MSQNVQFTTQPPDQLTPILLSLEDYENGEVELVATDCAGKRHVLGIFKNGRLGLVYVCDDAKRSLGIQINPHSGCLSAVPYHHKRTAK